MHFFVCLVNNDHTDTCCNEVVTKVRNDESFFDAISFNLVYISRVITVLICKI